MKTKTLIKLLVICIVASITYLAIAVNDQMHRIDYNVSKEIKLGKYTLKELYAIKMASKEPTSFTDNTIKVSGQYLQDANSQGIQNASQLVTETYNPQKTIDGDYLQKTAILGNSLMVK